MWMSNIHKSFLSYCLVPTPDVLVEDEMRRISWKRGEAGEVSQEVENEVRAFHNLEAIPIINRIKSFEVTLNSDDIVKMRDKVSLAREYYNTLK